MSKSVSAPDASTMGAVIQRQAASQDSPRNSVGTSNSQDSSRQTPPYAATGRTVVRIPQRPLDRHQTLPFTSANPPPLLEALKQRLRILEVENRRLMANQGQLVSETNRRVEMNINEVRLLKEEVKNLQVSNKELRDLCCFLDDDRQKTRRLSREWQKFGRYTSEVMKQEVKAYQNKLRELEERQQLLINENDELKRLCLYLDEQRQSLLLAKASGGGSFGLNVGLRNSNGKVSDNSLGCDSSGCGSSTGSHQSTEDEDGDEAVKHHVDRSDNYDDKQENTLRLITQQMQTSMCLENGETINNHKEQPNRNSDTHNEKLFEYIQSLENRIRNLEVSNQQHEEAFWKSKTNLISELEKETEVEKEEWAADKESGFKNTEERPTCRVDGFPVEKTCVGKEYLKKEMIESTTSTMTSSGTTFCSSGTDESAETAVFVMGNEMDAGASMLEVRTLGPIDEEKEEDSCRSDSRSLNFHSCWDSNSPARLEPDSARLPPTIEPISASVSRLSLCSSEVSLDGISNSPSRQHILTSGCGLPNSNFQDFSEGNDGHKQTLRPEPDDNGNSTVRDSLAEAVKVLRVHEMAARKNMRGMTAQETAIVQHMCQIAWDSLDRKSQSLGNNRPEQKNPGDMQMTAV